MRLLSPALAPGLGLALGLLGLIAAAQPARAADTLLWVGVRTGLMFYNEVDPDALEDLATALSVDRQSTSGTRINFDEKGWEIPINLQLGWRINSSLNLWGFFQRMPYTLEGPLPDRFPLPIDTVRLDAPANVFGGGLDFRLGSEGYGSSLLMGAAIGTFESSGGDQDIQGYRNFTIDASGFYWEVSLMAELDFSTELAFYPFVSFQGTSTDQVSATIVPRGGGIINDVEIPPFDIDYMAITIGLSVRFRVYPFDTEGNPEEGDVE